MKRLLLTLLFVLTFCSVNYSQGAGTAASIYRTTNALLSTQVDGSVRYCTDCQQTNPCTGGGTGAYAFKVVGAWECAGTGTIGSTISGSGTNNTVPKFTGTNTIGNSSVTDNGTQVTGTESFQFPALGLGVAPPTLGIKATEGAAPTGAAGSDFLYPDSTAHRWVMNNNNGGAVNVVASGADINTSDQVTVTHLAAALPVAQGGTAVATITGMVSGNGTTGFVGRTITAGSASIVVTNGSGATANPTVDTVQSIQTSATPQFTRLTLGETNTAALLDISGTPAGTTQLGIRNVFTAGSGATVAAYGDYTLLQTAVAAFTITNAYGKYIDSPSLGAGSAIATGYGIYINTQKVTGVTTGYGIRQVGASDKNQFDANLITPGIAPAADSTTALQIFKADGTTRIVDVDTTNARVGINKTPGAFDLDVNGAVNFASSLAVTGTITPSQTNGIVGTTTNNNANTGSVGEFVSSTIATGSSVSLTTNTVANITSISLTAGDWEVTGAIDFTFGATTSYTNLVGGISTTSATIGAQDSAFDFETPAAVPTASADATFVVPVVRISIASTTTVFLVVKGTFTVSTLKAYGTIRAWRVR